MTRSKLVGAPSDLAADHPVDLLSDLISGTLSADVAVAVRAHIDSCSSCAAELAAWRAVAQAARDRSAAYVPSADMPERIAARIVGDAAPRPSFGRRLRWLLRFVTGQVPLVRREIWSASVVVISIGLGVSLLSTGGSEPGRAFALFAPLAAALGVAMIYGHENDPSLELALATPVSPRLVVLARLVLVLAMDLALALASSLVLMVVDGPAYAASLVGLWLGPMLLLGCLSLALSLVVGTNWAIAIGSILWIVRVFEFADGSRAQTFGELGQALNVLWQTSPLTIGLSAVILLLALAFARAEAMPASQGA